ncbi:IS5 family transposase [Actinomyces sp. Z3]|uniref:IS5 family transposase n=1 Tax=Actinomyces sp. Z3 TaxID=2250217 RepID=UPI00215D58E9|nr:IS5 family transposase [Actinomyces sp. Z3]
MPSGSCSSPCCPPGVPVAGHDQRHAADNQSRGAGATYHPTTGPGGGPCALYRTWQTGEVWEHIEAALVTHADAAGKVGWRMSVDSTTCRAHVHAAGARKESVRSWWRGSPRTTPWEPLGAGGPPRTRAAVDAACGMLVLLLTAGQAADCPMMIPVLEEIRVAHPGPGRPRTRPQMVLADKAYSSRANRDWLRNHHIQAAIPVKADQAAHRRAGGSRGGRPPAFDPIAYKDRNAVERCFGQIKQNRAMATRYDKLAVRYQATTHIASTDH